MTPLQHRDLNAEPRAPSDDALALGKLLSEVQRSPAAARRAELQAGALLQRAPALFAPGADRGWFAQVCRAFWCT